MSSLDIVRSEHVIILRVRELPGEIERALEELKDFEKVTQRVLYDFRH